MSIDFDWEISEEDQPQLDFTPPNKKWRGWIIPVISLVFIASIASYLYVRLNNSERQLRQAVQGILALEDSAFKSGDGELFFSFFDEDDDFRYAQLLPENQSFHSAEPTVTKVEQHENILWANILYPTTNGNEQRIGFFEQTGVGLRQIATDTNYWGNTIDTTYAWGVLRLHETDEVWAETFNERISTTMVSQSLSDQADAFNSTFAVIIRDDHEVSTIENVLHYPSPRLLGLNEDGEPTELYWQGLESLISTHLNPITIRFALPSAVQNDPTMIKLFEGFAVEFAAQYPEDRISVELVTSEQLSQDPQQWLPTVDAAMYHPSEALIKTGAVYDLTTFVSRDSGFDTGDFYDQAWRGAWWNDRMWMVPWSTSINLLYFDIAKFNDQNLPVPNESWDWQQLSAVLAQFDQPALTDGSRDTLFAYALSQDASCTQPKCVPQLTKSGVQAALEWYRQSILDTQTMTPLAKLGDEDRLQFIQDSLSVGKDVAIWVDTASRYEYQSQLQNTRVMPLLRYSAENTQPVMPVHINGHIMSQHTDSPYWTWQWLKFISYKASLAAFRDIPARPSATRQSGYWEWLPSPIVDALRSATANTRPILIGEERYFTWAQLDGIVSGTMSLEESAEPIPAPWFNAP